MISDGVQDDGFFDCNDDFTCAFVYRACNHFAINERLWDSSKCLGDRLDDIIIVRVFSEQKKFSINHVLDEFGFLGFWELANCLCF